MQDMVFEEINQQIADYVMSDQSFSDEAYDTIRLCLLDAMGCAMQALRFDACLKVLGPIVPDADMPKGVRVPGSQFHLDPVQAAFNFAAMIRWLDYNDTWLAAEWGHPSDNFGAILVLADYISRPGPFFVGEPLSVKSVLTWAIKAYEIQGVLALNHAFNREGLDHVILVKLASAAVCTAMLGGDRSAVLRVLSQVWLDGHALRTYRHAPNTGSRKSWAAGDACARAVWLSLMTHRGEMGYASALSAPTWGFQDVLFGGKTLHLARPLACYVAENILFKVSYPAEFHAQTAVEIAVDLHAKVAYRLDDISRIDLYTHEAAIRIIDKTGPLSNPADRDHCLQYMVAVALINGHLAAEDYDDMFAKDPRIDKLRDLMHVQEEDAYTQAYMDPDRRAIGNAIQIRFSDGSTTERVEILYPLGHKQRRGEATSILAAKFKQNVRHVMSLGDADALLALFQDKDALYGQRLDALMRRF